MSHRVAIVAAGRTPIGKFLGAFRNHSAVELGTTVVSGVLARAGIAPGEVEECIFGNARQAGGGPNPGRQVSVRAGIPESAPAYTVNAACGSGLKSIALAADSIRGGRADCIVAGGTESMTRVPFFLERARLGYRLGHSKMVDGMYRDGFLCPLSDMVMGKTAEILAGEYAIGREAQDRWAALSQNRSERAREAGLFDAEIVPVEARDDRGETRIVTRDEHPRSGVTPEALSKLPTVFDDEGTVTAGNASGITDGAAALVLTSEAAADRLKVAPMAYVRDFVVVGVDPKRMGIGPVPATRALLERNEMTVEDVPVIELNEAFAAQVLACMSDLDLDQTRVNPNGGSISLGHPIGCTGARIVVTLLHELQRSGSRLGLATLCVSGGLGMAMLIERG